MLRLHGRRLVGAAALCGCPSAPPQSADGEVSTDGVGELATTGTSHEPSRSTSSSVDSTLSEGTTGSSSDEGANATSGMTEVDGSETSGSTSLSEVSDASSTGPASINAAPHASADVYLAWQDQTLTVDAAAGVLSNDFDPDADPLSVLELEDVMTSSGATVTLHSNGSFTYTPAESWWGEDAFEYTVTDEANTQAIGRVRVVVHPTAAPLASVSAGIGGFALDGEAERDQVGYSVSGAGDFNGDGLSDIIIGASSTDPSGHFYGRPYVVFGRTDGLSPALQDVSNGIGGFSLPAQVEGDYADFTVSGAGDFNGDGLSDIIIGARDADAMGSASGRSYLVFGRTDGLSPALQDVSNGIGGFSLHGQAEGEYLGYSVSGAGDFNGDGLSDILIGAPGASPNGSFDGRAYLVFGRADGHSPSLEDISNGVGGFSLEGQAEGDFSGASVTCAGDFNGDGLSDILLGAPLADGNGSSSGRSYLVFGRSDGLPPALEDVSNGVGGFSLEGEVGGDESGHAVSGAGDFNGDGLSDILIGAPGAAPQGNGSGRSYIVFGRSDGSAPSLQDVSQGIGGFALDGQAGGDQSGSSVSGGGDLNGDGLSDIVIGASRADPNRSSSGRSYVVLGRIDGSPPSLEDVSNGIGGFALDGQTASERAGFSVSGAGDLNGDGFSDIILGAPGAGANGSQFGRSYMVYGGDFTRSTAFAGTPEDDVFTGTPAAESIIGGLGNDQLFGGGGADILYGGPGNDTLTVGDNAFFRIDGGTGEDTLSIDSSIDLTERTDIAIRNIEIIDITGTGNNGLGLRLSTVLSLSNTRTLTILGDAGDELVVDLRGAGFVRANTLSFVQFTSALARVTLRVDRDIDVSFVQH